MKHRKLYSSQRLQRNNRVLIVEGPVATEQLRSLHMHAGLKHLALLRISSGRLRTLRLFLK